MLATRVLSTAKRALDHRSTIRASRSPILGVGQAREAKNLSRARFWSVGIRTMSWQRWYSSGASFEDHQMFPWARGNINVVEKEKVKEFTKPAKEAALLASLKRGDMKQLSKLVEESDESDWCDVRTVVLILRSYATLYLDASKVLQYCVDRIEEWSDSEFEQLAPVLLGECRQWRNVKMKEFSERSRVPQLIYQCAKNRSGVHLSSAFYVNYAKALIANIRSAEEQKHLTLELIRILEDTDPSQLDSSPFCSTILQNLVDYHGIAQDGWYWGGTGCNLYLYHPSHRDELVSRIWSIFQAKGVPIDLKIATSCLKAFAAGHMNVDFAEHIHQALLAQQIDIPPYLISLIIAGLYTRGLYADALQWISVLNQSSSGPLPRPANLLCLTVLMNIHAKKGEIEAAKAVLDQAMELCKDKPFQVILPAFQARYQPLTRYLSEKYAFVPDKRKEGKKQLIFLQLVPHFIKLGHLELAISLVEDLTTQYLQHVEDLYGLKECLQFVRDATWDESKKSNPSFSLLCRLTDSVNRLPNVIETIPHRKILKKSVFELRDWLKEMRHLPQGLDTSNTPQIVSEPANGI